MTNGTTREEEWVSLLREARGKQKQTQEVIKQSEIDAKYWGEYADTLERMIELERQKHGISMNGHQLNAERLRKQSTWNNLLDIISANNGILVAVDATGILVEAGVIDDREHARNLIYSTLHSHSKDVEKIREGVYRLRKRSNTKKSTTIIRIGYPKKRRVVKSGIRERVRILKELHPQMTKKQMLNRLLNEGFNFKGKKPTSAINVTWAYLGYSRENKQQSLLEIS